MLRLGLVLTVVALPLVGIEVISARQQEPVKVFQSAEDAVLACRIWQEAERTFTAIGGDGQIQSALRSYEADLDHPVILGRRFSVVAGAHTTGRSPARIERLPNGFPIWLIPRHWP